MIDKLLKNEIDFKYFSKNVDVNSALDFYKMFGHVGIFDHIFLGTDKEYMLRYPQVYFSKVFSDNFPEHLQKLVETKFCKFNSKIFTEVFKPENMMEFSKFEKVNCKKVFVNKDGNFVLRSSSFEYVANFSGSLFTISKENMERILEKKYSEIA